ncbi:MAG: hypothetical protein ACOYO7_04940 [Phycisphaerales bacterium]|jgi:hypothetical protein
MLAAQASDILPVVGGTGPGSARRVLDGAMDAFRLLAVVRALGIPAECSSDAGRFLCNEVMFHVLERRARHGAPACARSSAASQGCACAMQK